MKEIHPERNESIINVLSSILEEGKTPLNTIVVAYNAYSNSPLSYYYFIRVYDSPPSSLSPNEEVITESSPLLKNARQHIIDKKTITITEPGTYRTRDGHTVYVHEIKEGFSFPVKGTIHIPLNTGRIFKRFENFSVHGRCKPFIISQYDIIAKEE